MGLLARHISSLLYRCGGSHIASTTTLLNKPLVTGCCKNISTSSCCRATTSTAMAPLVTLPLAFNKCIPMNRSSDFTSFLREAKSLVGNSSNNGEIHVVIGNEAADLDSVVSALVYAFYLSHHAQPGDECLTYVPVIAIPKDDICLRTEVIALLSKLELSVDEFVYLDDVNFNGLPISGVTLVDFNNRANHIKDISDKVTRIVDHHEESGDFQNITKTLETCGSCATLVTEEMHYSQQHSHLLKIPPISTLLLSAILVDTYNLDLHSGRTTELDVFMGEILSQNVDEEPDQLFDYLQKAKMDISSMKTYDILRKDYKSVPRNEQSTVRHTLGISSATISSSRVLSRNDFLEASKSYMSKEHIDTLVIMFLSFNENSTSPRREIAVVSMTAGNLEKVTSYLVSNEELQLCAKKIDLPEENVRLLPEENVRLFDQNPKHSRKFVLPFLKRMYEDDL